MKKIPTLFKRDPENMRRVLPEITSGCEWVLAGEGIATRKYDGTCVMLDADGWWARREIKPGKTSPPNFRAIEHDENTGKTVGWEPIEQSSFYKFWDEAKFSPETLMPLKHGTYELVGPKINGNPEDYEMHTLIPHEGAAVLPLDPDDLSYERLAEIMLEAKGHVEGIVWHHPDGRMAKLKVRDFS